MSGKGYGCEYCGNYVYDGDLESYTCGVDMDEDDYAMLMEGRHDRGCPYFCAGDEYEVVKHQAI
ncbi:MAG: DUF6472 family protein [Lachnospiraceae bacterium]|jgi:hypothetical protein